MEEEIGLSAMMVDGGMLWMAEAASVAGILLDPALAYRGLIQFNGNQCALHLDAGADAEVAAEGEGASARAELDVSAWYDGLLPDTLSSVAVAGVGDIGFDANQCTVESARRMPQALTNALVAGHTIRVTGNLFREGLDDSWLSAICAGLADTVTDNQAIHCILAIPCLGPYARVLPNTVLLGPTQCAMLNIGVNLLLYQLAKGALAGTEKIDVFK